MERPMNYREVTAICDFDYLPDGLEAKYDRYLPDGEPYLIPRGFLNGIFERYQTPEETRQWIEQGILAIEEDAVLFHFTKFWWRICARLAIAVMKPIIPI